MWQLFIDESGDFSVPGTRVVAGGLLVRAMDTPAGRQWLRTQLEGIYPHVPYPPHATDLKNGISHVLSWMLTEHTPAARGASAVVKACAPAAAAIRASAADAPQRLCDVAARLAEGKHVTRQERWNAVGDCRVWLEREHHNASRSLDALARVCEENMLALLDCILQQYGPRECFVLASEEFPSVDLTSDSVGERYLPVLRTALERVRHLLASPSTPLPVVFAHVGSRDVFDPLSSSRRKMRRRDLERTRQEAFATLLGGRLEIVMHPPADYDSAVHPGLVLADFIVNRVWGEVLRAGHSWGNARRAAEVCLGLPIEAPSMLAGAGPLPTCAEHGTARDAIDAAFTGKPQGGLMPSLTGCRSVWAREQARAWIEALR